jgi:hypothetical protein
MSYPCTSLSPFENSDYFSHQWNISHNLSLSTSGISNVERRNFDKSSQTTPTGKAGAKVTVISVAVRSLLLPEIWPRMLADTSTDRYFSWIITRSWYLPSCGWSVHKEHCGKKPPFAPHQAVGAGVGRESSKRFHAQQEAYTSFLNKGLTRIYLLLIYIYTYINR